jgi:hypothetical protein
MPTGRLGDFKFIFSSDLIPSGILSRYPVWLVGNYLRLTSSLYWTSCIPRRAPLSGSYSRPPEEPRDLFSSHQPAWGKITFIGTDQVRLRGLWCAISKSLHGSKILGTCGFRAVAAIVSAKGLGERVYPFQLKASQNCADFKPNLQWQPAYSTAVCRYFCLLFG